MTRWMNLYLWNVIDDLSVVWDLKWNELVVSVPDMVCKEKNRSLKFRASSAMLQKAACLKLSVETDSFLALWDWPLQSPDCGQDLRANGKPELGLGKPGGDQREGWWMHIFFGCLTSQKVLQAADLLTTLWLKLINLQPVVGVWLEMRENKNTNAMLTIFSESQSSRSPDLSTLGNNMTRKLCV